MHDAPVCSAILKVNKPPFLAARRVYQCPLMRTIDRGLPLSEHDLFFVRAVDIPGRSKDVVIAVELVNLRALDRRMSIVSVKYHDAVIEQ
jgi:hypothetical protein